MNNYAIRKKYLAQNLTANGRGPVVDVSGDYKLLVYGTFGGGTVTIQNVTDRTATPNPTLAPAQELLTFTAANAGSIVTFGGPVQVVLSGATGADITVELERVKY